MTLPVDPIAYLSEHYVYELKMLREAYRRIGPTTDQFLKNALIESFCVHARALMDFYKSQRRLDDVLATDFIPSGQFGAAATSGLPGDLRDRMNKQIAHLTVSRENAKKINDDDRWSLISAIETDHAAFKNAVDQKYAGCFSKEDRPVLVRTGSGGATNAITTH